jgi:hypothetical protein
LEIAAGPDGNLWFTEAGRNRIGRITTAGVLTEFSAGISPGGEPEGIAVGPDGNLWFTEIAGNRIGRLDLAQTAADTTTTLRTSTATAVFGQTELLTSTVNSEARVPTGTVIFKDGNMVLGTAQLNAASQATLAVSLGVGNHALTASFVSNAPAGSNSAAVAVTVNRATSMFALGSSVNSAGTGLAVSFTATVAAVAPGAGTPTGTVTFKDGSVILGMVAVGASGQATFTTSFAVAGGHVITAVYNGDPNFAGSSQALTEQVNAPATPQATTTSLLTSANPVVVGQVVTFTATVRGPARAGTPTGTVPFFVSNTMVARVTLDANGQACLTRSFSRTGLFAIRAVYRGDAGFAASSQSLTDQVNRS